MVNFYLIDLKSNATGTLHIQAMLKKIAQVKKYTYISK